MSDYTSEIVIIGCGIIGGALSYKLANLGYKNIIVIDKEDTINQHQTGRNSGVIHSGVYYPKGSLKSHNCIDGYNQIIGFLDEYKIPYKIPGKLIVAADEAEYGELERLYQNAVDVGLQVNHMDREDILEIDPNLVSKKGFFVKETGLTDYKKVLEKFVDIGRNSGVKYLFSSPIKEIIQVGSSFEVKAGNKTISTKYIINCTGLQSDRVYELSTGLKSPVTIIPFKGEYFKVPKDSYNSDIAIYPVPNPDFPFLGVHLTRMIDGTLKVGPNAVLSFSREGYDGFEFNLKDAISNFSTPTLFNIAKKYKSVVLKELLKHKSKSFFEESVRKYWNNFDRDSIIGYTCGIRAQATENGKLVNDFKIVCENNQVHVLNAPSPAATSCLSIADTIINEFENLR